MKNKDIWVLPEIKTEEGADDKISLGMLTAAHTIAEKAGGAVTTILLGEQYQDYSEILGKYGVNRSYFFQDPLLRYFSAEAYADAILTTVKQENPFLILLADTVTGRELAPRLAGLLNAGLVTRCIQIDFENPQSPNFYRAIYGGQLYQKIVVSLKNPVLVTLASGILSNQPCTHTATVETIVIKPELSPESLPAEHISYLPADFGYLDICDADTIVGAGMGAVTDEIMPLVEELARLIDGTLGTTRPVVDEGKIPREKLIGQTGNIVSPNLYLALGISGATFHVAGIQDARKIVAINRDRGAPIFQSADTGIYADLKDVLPQLIERIRRAKENGEII